jgi:nucleotide-binding universal stress UspA family protein
VENSNIKDLLKLRYNKAVDYVVLNGDPEQTMIDFLSKQGEHAMVVMGAYGRSAISRLFQQSFSNRVIQELKLPVFITHQ